MKRSEKDTDGIYALSPNWYRDWENFVCEKSSGNIDLISYLFFNYYFVKNKKEAPGPISNAGISTTKNGVSRLLRRGMFFFL